MCVCVCVCGKTTKVSEAAGMGMKATLRQWCDADHCATSPHQLGKFICTPANYGACHTDVASLNRTHLTQLYWSITKLLQSS